jgi:hypothetical protein
MTTTWSEPAGEPARMQWLIDTATALVDAGAGDAANTLNHFTTITSDRIRRIYGAAVYDRLAELKAVHDPENVFHRNINVPPRA